MSYDVEKQEPRRSFLLPEDLFKYFDLYRNTQELHTQ